VNWARAALGVAVLGALAWFLVLLWPAYYHHWQFERALKGVAADAAATKVSDEVARQHAMEQAAHFDIPLEANRTSIERHADGSLRMQAPYVVHVDAGVYTVDLHFHAGADSR
jgi:hypothetical protein